MASIPSKLHRVHFKYLRNALASVTSGLRPRITTPPYNHVTQIGDPILRNRCARIEPAAIASMEIQRVIRCLRSALKVYGSLGLSAPQVGVPLSIFIMECNRKQLSEFKKDEIGTKEIALLPQTVVINPELRITDYGKLIFAEGCESVRGLTADVERYRAVELKGLNENGDELLLPLSGWMARVAQHEMDHLNGKLYTDVMNPTSLACTCWQEVNKEGGKIEMPFRPFSLRL